jgi:urea transporter
MKVNPPANPYLVLAVATVLPGVGQVMNRQPMRGLFFVFFILLLGAFTLKTAAPDVSIVGKLSGGIFVYAMAIFDAYRLARVRFETWRHGEKTAV